MASPARRQLGAGSPGKVVPDSSSIHLGNTVRCQVYRVKCNEWSGPLGGVPAPGLRKRALQRRAEEAGPRSGLLPPGGVSFQQPALWLRGRTQPVSTSLGDFCPYLGCSLKDAVAKLSEVTAIPKGNGKASLSSRPATLTTPAPNLKARAREGRRCFPPGKLIPRLKGKGSLSPR